MASATNACILFPTTVYRPISSPVLLNWLWSRPDIGFAGKNKISQCLTRGGTIVNWMFPAPESEERVVGAKLLPYFSGEKGQGEDLKENRMRERHLRREGLRGRELRGYSAIWREAAAVSTDGGREGGMAETGRVLITFDVDGTLMQSLGENANLLHKKAFSYAMEEVFGIVGTIDAIKHHGSTDPLVLINTLEHYGIPPDTATVRLHDLKDKMLDYARNNAGQIGEGLELLPGVQELLQSLVERRSDVVVGLVTGNLEEIAWMKMEGLGIKQYFSSPNFGGFGSDHSDRGELVKLASSRAEAYYPGEFSLRVHVGDTPNDIRAAEYGGALALGVCTGVFSRDDLLAASDNGTAIILEDLKDSGIFFKACNIT